MPRKCSVCMHPDREAIDSALLSGEPLRGISRKSAISEDALARHRNSGHVSKKLSQARDAAEVAQADDLLNELKMLRAKAYGLLISAERQGDIRAALAGFREARSCLELLAEMEGELDRRQTVNVILSPEWQQVRQSMIRALRPYPEARIAVAESLYELEAGSDGHGT